MGIASACRSGEGSKRRSRVEMRAASGRLGRDVMAGRKGVAVGLGECSAMVMDGGRCYSGGRCQGEESREPDSCLAIALGLEQLIIDRGGGVIAVR